MMVYFPLCLLISAAVWRNAECQVVYPGNSGTSGNAGGNADNSGFVPINSGNSGNSGNTGGNAGNSGYPFNSGYPSNSGNSGFNSGGTFVPANQRNCKVESIKAQPMFDMKSFEGEWKVLKRTNLYSVDPIILGGFQILADSIFFKTTTNSMTAEVQSITNAANEKVMIVKGTQTIAMNFFGMKVATCTTIPPVFLTARNPAEPGKLSIRYRTGEYLPEIDFKIDLTELVTGILGRNFFEFYVLSTDYQNYAIVWNCKRVGPKGECKDNMVMVMGRGKGPLSYYYEQLVKTKLATICVEYNDLEDEVHEGGVC